MNDCKNLDDCVVMLNDAITFFAVVYLGLSMASNGDLIDLTDNESDGLAKLYKIAECKLNTVMEWLKANKGV
ncbi:MAG: hypothetical protein LBI78_04265 [Campylobacteraceae bacterium]|jgi:hypothetical protein|nr:hypothetical protein [Campylobacteraceae bacterium]